MSDSDYYVRLAIDSGDTELAALVDGTPLPHEQTEITDAASIEIADICQQLQQLRRQTKLSQQQLAAKLGMAQSSLARIEAGKGNPTLRTLQAIAAALDAEITVRPQR